MFSLNAVEALSGALETEVDTANQTRKDAVANDRAAS
jgi:hypothetical protein